MTELKTYPQVIGLVAAAGAGIATLTSAVPVAIALSGVTAVCAIGYSVAKTREANRNNDDENERIQRRAVSADNTPRWPNNTQSQNGYLKISYMFNTFAVVVVTGSTIFLTMDAYDTDPDDVNSVGSDRPNSIAFSLGTSAAFISGCYHVFFANSELAKRRERLKEEDAYISNVTVAQRNLARQERDALQAQNNLLRVQRDNLLAASNMLIIAEDMLAENGNNASFNEARNEAISKLRTLQ